MEKKISKKEREEVVTKSFLVDHLDSKNYVTKSFLVDYLDSKNYITKSFLVDYLDSKNYITKDYFEARLESTINKALEKQSKEFYQHMEALMEHQMNSLQVFWEHMDERYVLRKEWLSYRGI